MAELILSILVNLQVGIYMLKTAFHQISIKHQVIAKYPKHQMDKQGATRRTAEFWFDSSFY